MRLHEAEAEAEAVRPEGGRRREGAWLCTVVVVVLRRPGGGGAVLESRARGARWPCVRASCRTLLDARMHVVPSFDKKVRNSRCMFPVFLVVPYECVKKDRICRGCVQRLTSTNIYNNFKRSVTASKKSTVTIAPNDQWRVALQQTVVSTLHQVYPLET